MLQISNLPSAGGTPHNKSNAAHLTPPVPLPPWDPHENIIS